MRAWLPHLALLFLLAVELGAARVLHKTDAELQTLRRSGTSQQQLDALHVLTNRGEPDPQTYGGAFIRELMSSSDPRVRDYAYSTDVCKFQLPNIQGQAFNRETGLITEGEKDPSAEWFRAFVIHQRKVGGGVVGGTLRLRAIELHWFLDAVEDVAPPRVPLIKHLNELWREMKTHNQDGSDD